MLKTPHPIDGRTDFAETVPASPTKPPYHDHHNHHHHQLGKGASHGDKGLRRARHIANPTEAVILSLSSTSPSLPSSEGDYEVDHSIAEPPNLSSSFHINEFGNSKAFNYFDSHYMIERTAKWHRRKEGECLPSMALFQQNPDILPTMRCKLINWILEVSLHFKLHRETFYLAIHYVDTYLSRHWGLTKAELQLIAVASLFIAAKLEEIHPPKLKEFAEISDGNCSAAAIHRMELDILMTLQWRLNFSTVFYWLGCYLELLRGSPLQSAAIEPLRAMTLEVLDLAVHAPGFVIFPYSMLAAAALFIRLQDPQLIYRCSRYRPDDMGPCLDWLWSFFRCPDCIIYFDPRDSIEEEEYHDAIGINYRVMTFLSDSVRHGHL